MTSEEDDLHSLPSDLPTPVDDGACDHLAGRRLPSLALVSTSGAPVDLSALHGLTIVYIYPRTGKPEEPGSREWDAIPGARGCTPESCAFRDRHAALQTLGTRVFGLSTQTTAYQREAVERLHLPFPLLSDSTLDFANALRLPAFDFEPYGDESRVHLERATLVVRDGRIEKVFYPVFPPDRHAAEVLAWLEAQAAGSLGG